MVHRVHVLLGKTLCLAVLGAFLVTSSVTANTVENNPSAQTQEEAIRRATSDCQQITEIPYYPLSGDLDILQAISACDYAMNNMSNPPDELIYAAASVHLSAGNYSKARKIFYPSWRLDGPNVPALGVLWAQLEKHAPWNGSSMNEIRDKFSTIDGKIDPLAIFWIGTRLVLSSHFVSAETERKERLGMAVQMFASAADATKSAEAYFYLGRTLLILHTLTKDEDTLRIAKEQLQNASDKGSPIADFYLTILSIEEGASLNRANAAFIDAHNSKYREALWVALYIRRPLHDDPSDPLRGAALKAERDQTVHIVAAVRNDPVLHRWYQAKKPADLDALGLPENSTLVTTLLRGFSQSAYWLFEDHKESLNDIARLNILDLASSQNFGGKVAPFVRERVSEEYNDSESLDARTLRRVIGIYQRLYDEGDILALLDGATVVNRNGLTSATNDWLTLYLQHSLSDDYDSEWYTRDFLTLVHELQLDDIKSIHRKGWALNGSKYSRIFRSYMRNRIYGIYHDELEKFLAWKRDAEAFVSVSPLSQKNYKTQWYSEVLEREISVAHRLSKPRCELYEEEYAGYIVNASFEGYSVRRKEIDVGKGGYRYLFSDNFETGVGFETFWLVHRDTPITKDNRVYSHRSQEKWMLIENELELNFDGGSGAGLRTKWGQGGGPGLGWYSPVDPSKALPRALQGGSTLLSVQLQDNQTFNTTYQFDGFSDAIAHAAEKYRTIKQVYEARECLHVAPKLKPE